MFYVANACKFQLYFCLYFAKKYTLESEVNEWEKRELFTVQLAWLLVHLRSFRPNQNQNQNIITHFNNVETAVNVQIINWKQQTVQDESHFKDLGNADVKEKKNLKWKSRSSCTENTLKLSLSLSLWVSLHQSDWAGSVYVLASDSPCCFVFVCNV